MSFKDEASMIQFYHMYNLPDLEGAKAAAAPKRVARTAYFNIFNNTKPKWPRMTRGKQQQD
jgi:hypothetical protein